MRTSLILFFACYKHTLSRNKSSKPMPFPNLQSSDVWQIRGHLAIQERTNDGLSKEVRDGSDS